MWGALIVRILQEKILSLWITMMFMKLPMMLLLLLTMMLLLLLTMIIMTIL